MVGGGGGSAQLQQSLMESEEARKEAEEEAARANQSRRKLLEDQLRQRAARRRRTIGRFSLISGSELGVTEETIGTGKRLSSTRGAQSGGRTGTPAGGRTLRALPPSTTSSLRQTINTRLASRASGIGGFAGVTP